MLSANAASSSAKNPCELSIVSALLAAVFLVLFQPLQDGARRAEALSDGGVRPVVGLKHGVLNGHLARFCFL